MKKLIYLLTAALLVRISFAYDTRNFVSVSNYWVEAVNPNGAFVLLGGSTDKTTCFVYGLTNVYAHKTYGGVNNSITGIRTNDLIFNTGTGFARFPALIQVPQDELDRIATNAAYFAKENQEKQEAYADALKQASMAGYAEVAFDYIQRRAERGSPSYQYQLGYKYLIGEYPAELNNNLGMYWMNKAAKNGNNQAKKYLEALNNLN